MKSYIYIMFSADDINILYLFLDTLQFTLTAIKNKNVI